MSGTREPMPRIVHITDEFSPQGGIAGMIMQLARHLTGQCWTTSVLTADVDAGSVPGDLNLIKFPVVIGGVWRFPQGLTAYLERLTQENRQIFHLHGVWMASQWLAARVARQQKAPALLSPHGMLNRWHFKNPGIKELKKLIYWHTMAYPAFRHLPLIHAVTAWERDELARYFPGQRIEVIPNALDLGAMDQLLSNRVKNAPLPVEEPYLLFLGRLHPVKGVDLLIKAFAKSVQGAGRKFRLCLAGPDTVPAYAASLRSLVNELGLEEKVIFTGPVMGPQKIALYRRAWAFCLPSHSEVVGMVNLEAAALKLPVVTTHETGLSDWEAGGGVLVHPRVEELSRALERVFSWSESERRDRGQKLRQLVEQRYSWQAVGPQWLELYSRLAS